MLLFNPIKRVIENLTGCRIYRNSLPHGANMFMDIERRFGRANVLTVCDVGANVGQSALEYLREFPNAQIYSFEPVASTFKELSANTSGTPRIHAFNLGMGPNPGSVDINVNAQSVKSSITLSRPGDHFETIQLETLARFAAEHSIPNIDFLKIDTEGFDLEVLIGAQPLLENQQIALIQTECEPITRTNDFMTLAQTGEFLRGFGYELFGIYEQQPEWDGRNMLLYCNAVFVSPRLVPRKARLR